MLQTKVVSPSNYSKKIYASQKFFFNTWKGSELDKKISSKSESFEREKNGCVTFSFPSNNGEEIASTFTPP